MNNKSNGRHIFALYYEKTVHIKEALGKTITIEDIALYRRIVHVLRFFSGSSCILFDKHYHVQVTVQEIHKKSITWHVLAVSKNLSFSPNIFLLLPVLKRQALSDAIYCAVETGVSEIQLIITEKIQRSWGGQKELDRLRDVAISACEQAKYFDIPEIKAPVIMQKALDSLPSEMMRIHYDVTGISFSEFFKKDTRSIALLVGPEAGLIEEEKQHLIKHNFNFVRLTPTILRASQAVGLGVGIVRAMNFLFFIYLF